MSTEPLSPQEVDAILTDPRSRAADLLVLRDALQRMGGALQRLANAVTNLQEKADDLDRRFRHDREVPKGRAERGD